MIRLADRDRDLFLAALDRHRRPAAARAAASRGAAQEGPRLSVLI